MGTLDREVARKEFIEKIQSGIAEWEKAFDKFVLLRVFLHLLEKQVFSGGGFLGKDDLPETPQEQRHGASCRFGQVMMKIRIFKRSRSEEKRLLMKLLVWTTDEIARQYYAALRAQEISASTPCGVEPFLLRHPVVVARRLKLIHSRGAADASSQ
jgi:hypothetical protein